MRRLEVVERLLGFPGERLWVYPRAPQGKFPHLLSARRSENRVPYEESAWWKDLLDGTRSPFEAIGDWIGSFEDKTFPSNLFLYREEAKQMSGWWREAGHKANGFKQAILMSARDQNQPSLWGLTMFDACNTPGLPHTWEHMRRVQELMKAFIFNTPELRHGPKKILEMVFAMALAGETHDWDQTYWEFYNYKNQLENPIKAKKGHAPAASVLVWILRNLYQFEAQVDKWDAQRTAALSMLFNLVHDEPEKLKMRFTAKGRAADYLDLSKEQQNNSKKLADFVDAWEKGLINPLSMTLGHVLILTKALKSKSGMNMESSSWGLPKEFEKEYGIELEAMSKDQRTLWEVIKPESLSFVRQMFRGAEVLARADRVDMNAPAWRAAVRMLGVGVSAKRPLVRVEAFEVMSQRVRQGSGNVEPEVDSDARRAYWQTEQQEAAPRDTLIGKSQKVRNFEDMVDLMYMIAYRNITMRLMKGDLSVIDEIYNQQILEITDKTLKKRGVNPIYRFLFKLPHAVMITIGDVKSDGLVKAVCHDMQWHDNYFDKRLQLLIAERDRIQENLRNKPDGVEGALKIYSPNEIEQYLRWSAGELKYFIKQRGISRSVVFQAKALVEFKLPPKGLRYKYYVSLAKPNKVKTWMEPSELVKEIREYYSNNGNLNKFYQRVT